MSNSKNVAHKSVPTGGWSAEEFEKHGTLLMQQIVSVQRKGINNHKRRFANLWQSLFAAQVNQLVKFASDRMPSKALGIYTSDKQIFDDAIRSVFDNKAQTANAVMNSTVVVSSVGVNSYLQTNKLLGNSDIIQSHRNELNRKLNNIGAKVTQINESTRRRLTRTINDSLATGAGITETIERVKRGIPSLNRRIPTIVRTELGRAADAGILQSLKQIGTVTHCSVIGCSNTADHPTLGVNCNIEDVPISEVDRVVFHINHTGTWVPSKFLTTDQILARRNELSPLSPRDPASFPSKPARQSVSSKDQHSKQDIYNNRRTELHRKIKSRVLVPRIRARGKADKPVLTIIGGAYGTKTPEFDALIGETNSVLVECQEIQKAFPEYKDKYSNTEPNDASSYVSDECRYLANEIIYEAIDARQDVTIDFLGSGSAKSLHDKLTLFGRKGHKIKAYYSVATPEYIESKAKDIAEATGSTATEYYRKATLTSLSYSIMRLVEAGLYDEITIYDSEENSTIFTYSKGIGSVKNKALYKRFLLHSERNKETFDTGGSLPFLLGSRRPERIKSTDTLEPAEIQTISTEIVNGIALEDSSITQSDDYVTARKEIEVSIAQNEANGFSLDFDRYWEI